MNKWQVLITLQSFFNFASDRKGSKEVPSKILKGSRDALSSM